MDKVIPLIYTLDNNYAMQAAVSLTSLFANNRKIHFSLYLVSDEICLENKEKLIRLTEKYDNEIHVVDMPDLDKLSGVQLNAYWWSKAAYCSLFLCDIIPDSVDRLIYLDPDTIVVGNIDPLVDILSSEEFDKYYGAACLDPSYVIKKYYGFKRNECYFNTGLMLINLKKWRENRIQDVFMKEAIRRNGKSIDVDQGYINCVLINKILKLPAKYNVSPLFYRDYNEVCKFFNKGEWYSKSEYDKAVKQPVMIHYSGGKHDRPWFSNCDHPKREEWRKYLAMTEWRDIKLQEYPPAPERSRVAQFIRDLIINNPFLVKIVVKKKFGFVPVQYRDL